VKRGLVVHPRDWLCSSWSFYESGSGLLPIDLGPTNPVEAISLTLEES
jgi:hypothetical protein